MFAFDVTLYTFILRIWVNFDCKSYFYNHIFYFVMFFLCCRQYYPSICSIIANYNEGNPCTTALVSVRRVGTTCLSECITLSKTCHMFEMNGFYVRLAVVKVNKNNVKCKNYKT